MIMFEARDIKTDDKAELYRELARQLEVAARDGGGDPGSNAALRTMVLKAKAAPMNNDLIDRAIKVILEFSADRP